MAPQELENIPFRSRKKRVIGGPALSGKEIGCDVGRDRETSKWSKEVTVIENIRVPAKLS
jgi:hypothetical protein